MKIPASVKKYWIAMNATAFQSGNHAVYIYCGMAGAHEAVLSVDPNMAVAPLTLNQLALVFLIAFGRSILKYIEDHPVTDLLPISATTPEVNKPTER